MDRFVRPHHSKKNHHQPRRASKQQTQSHRLCVCVCVCGEVTEKLSSDMRRSARGRTHNTQTQGVSDQIYQLQWVIVLFFRLSAMRCAMSPLMAPRTRHRASSPNRERISRFDACVSVRFNSAATAAAAVTMVWSMDEICLILKLNEPHCYLGRCAPSQYEGISMHTVSACSMGPTPQTQLVSFFSRLSVLHPRLIDVGIICGVYICCGKYFYRSLGDEGTGCF